MIAKRAFLTSLVLFFGHLSFGKPLVVAHRGASFDAPENTLPAFKLAWEQGADAIEGDFLLTKDGHIVCIHDRTTKRFCDQDLVVAKSTLKQLKALDVGSWKNEKYVGTRIPTISEVFATVPEGKKIFVEVKCGVEIIPSLVKEIEESNLGCEQIILICFKAEVVKSFKGKSFLIIRPFGCRGLKKTRKEHGTLPLSPCLQRSKVVQRMGLIRSIPFPMNFQKRCWMQDMSGMHGPSMMCQLLKDWPSGVFIQLPLIGPN